MEGVPPPSGGDALTGWVAATGWFACGRLRGGPVGWGLFPAGKRSSVRTFGEFPNLVCGLDTTTRLLSPTCCKPAPRRCFDMVSAHGVSTRVLIERLLDNEMDSPQTC